MVEWWGEGRLLESESMKPKTQIKIGQLAAITLLFVVLLNTLTVLFTFRNNIPDSIFWSDIWPIVFSNVLAALILGSFVLTVSRRLFKTSLFLLIVFIIGVIRRVIWVFSTAEEYYDFIWPVFELVPIFILFLAIIGMQREKLMAKSNN
ncbi:MAG: hypothetical protein ACYS8Y_02430 [Planctomycetota bacterium]